MQVASRSSLLRGAALAAPSVRCSGVKPFTRLVVVAAASEERLRLHNLSPEEGSRHLEKRKGRGYGAGQGGTCGFGNRGQKCRSGSGTRPGFEGGQTPLYRRLPKLRGIAGGMEAGLPDFVVVNLDDLEKHFKAGEAVTLEAVQAKIMDLSGRDAKLPLKILGGGSLTKSLTVHAASFSESAKAAIEAAGGKAEASAPKVKWTKWGYKKKIAEIGIETYQKDKLAKRVANLKSKGMFTERVAKPAKPAFTAAKKGGK